MKTIIAVVLALAAMFTAPVAQAEPVLVCPGGRSGVATYVTSCPFAQNVRQAYFAQGGHDIVAYSPVTGGVYNMSCYEGFEISLNSWPWSTQAVRCVGGDNAVVWVW